eukprot:355515-Chlamydomonas_euryale.AAC.5
MCETAAAATQRAPAFSATSMEPRAQAGICGRCYEVCKEATLGISTPSTASVTSVRTAIKTNHQSRATAVGTTYMLAYMMPVGCARTFWLPDRAIDCRIVFCPTLCWNVPAQVSCQPLAFMDGYGKEQDRVDNICYDPDASVIVKVTDACQCNYAPNSHSNRRWCCGDMYHMDLSVWAFEKLADRKWGVMGIKFRWVPCDYSPDRQAGRKILLADSLGSSTNSSGHNKHA